MSTHLPRATQNALVCFKARQLNNMSDLTKALQFYPGNWSLKPSWIDKNHISEWYSAMHSRPTGLVRQLYPNWIATFSAPWLSSNMAVCASFSRHTQCDTLNLILQFKLPISLSSHAHVRTIHQKPFVQQDDFLGQIEPFLQTTGWNMFLQPEWPTTRCVTPCPTLGLFQALKHLLWYCRFGELFNRL